MKSLFIAEKPSVAQEFAKALKENMKRGDGFLESDSYVVTWCVGHLVTMSYPEVYDEKYKRWSLSTLPFIPDHFLYEVIPGVKKQYTIVSRLLNRDDVGTIYVCTDSGREGEYIYRLVEQMAGVHGKERKRVWIDSQTEEEIHRGIREAKDLSAYDNLSAAAYLRAKEDYLMGINFSRLLTLKYGNTISNYLGTNYSVISVGRVMTCVLGMVVRREREIRQFVKTPFYRVIQNLNIQGKTLSGEFRAVETSDYYLSPKLYKENGFREKKDAMALIDHLMGEGYAAAQDRVSSENENRPVAVVDSVEKKKEKKNPPLLYNLAELQNDCSKMFKISPDETLRIVQELYEKKLVTYPRTDARVLSTAVAKEIRKNIDGLRNFGPAREFALEILDNGSYKGIGRTRYVNDKQITDHYAIIPTGQGFGALGSLKGHVFGVYAAIVRRFLSIFYPPAEFQRFGMVTVMKKEKFFFSFRVLLEEGYFKVAGNPYEKKQKEGNDPETVQGQEENGSGGQEEGGSFGKELLEVLKGIRKGMELPVASMTIKEGETSPPKRYNSGSMILAMENAGQLIEDEELRAQIKSCGIGTSATRAEILKKLIGNKYIALNKKTQILSPTLQGEMIYDVVYYSIRSLLNPELTASWEKGLNYVAEGTITSDEYMMKLENFIRSRTEGVLALNNQYSLRPLFDESAKYYKKGKSENGKAEGNGRRTVKSGKRQKKTEERQKTEIKN
ncbi:MAG: DNA topoisomerase [Candidatus Choladocola sp.]|nr:DNA topoisomerase [Candidatus Choladocola sp.]